MRAAFRRGDCRPGHVILEPEVALTSVPAPEQSLYEWSAEPGAAAPLSLINVLPGEHGGQPMPVPAELGSEEHAAGAVSDDGRRVVWLSKAPEHLYLRDVTAGQTVWLDAPQAGAGPQSPNPVFQVAAKDGSRVLFTDIQALTDSSGEGDLYECVVVEEAGGLGCELFDVTPLGGGGEQAKVQGVLGASEDASWVYFVANGVLGDNPGAVHGNCDSENTSSARVCNVYVRHDGVISLVAVVSGADLNDWNVNLAKNVSRVSPDGGWLEFMSASSLTGYDNVDVASGVADQEVFLYHALTGGLACVSCDPSGERPEGKNGLADRLVGRDKVWPESVWVAGLVPGWTAFKLNDALVQPRFLSDSGRLFFDGSGGLVSGDVDGTWDVYEYEPVGVGVGGVVCGAGSVSQGVVFKPDRVFVVGGRGGVEEAGCVGLVSGGSGSEESAFLDASESGLDVFFLTGARLSPVDLDNALDVYDAHACTGVSPCLVPVVSPPVCVSADACRAAPVPPPEIFGAPPSATFNGPGNVPSQASATIKPPTKKCKKGYVKKGTKCVRKHKAKKKAKKSKRRAK